MIGSANYKLRFLKFTLAMLLEKKQSARCLNGLSDVIIEQMQNKTNHVTDVGFLMRIPAHIYQ